MTLAPGSRLGIYEVLTLIGSGGMGEVYRARDTKLGRDVALKILPDTFAHDPERVARFSREAQLLAALNHPHIGAIYGLDDVSGQTFLVLELIDGETLAQCIAKGPLPLEDALPIARQIAEALEAAHDKGIVHRDLKPANIALTTGRNVKVLDFGLAKALEQGSGIGDQGSVDGMNSPTITSPAMMTGVGVILGTAAYMSPEQAKGRPGDRRSDMWAYGCVLYEMLTGQRAFGGKDATDVIAAIVRADPDWHALPANTPAPIRRLLRRCLEKDRQRRLADAADARLEIDDALAAPAAETPAVTPRRRVTPVAIAALVGGALIGWLIAWVLTRPAALPAVLRSRFAIVPPPAQPLGIPVFDHNLALSPDGRRLVYRAGVGVGAGGGSLALRDIDQLEPRLMDGITNAREPFFSADSRWIGFFEGEELKKVSITGGPAVTICQYRGMPAGASWDDDNTIMFATNEAATGLWRVPAAGGAKPMVLTTPDAAQHEGHHLYPSVLPGGRGVLFTIAADRPEDAAVAVLDLRTGQRKILIRGGSDAKYVDLSTSSPSSENARPSTGTYLVYVSAGTLRGVGFDLAKLKVLGEPVPVVDDVLVNGPGAAEYAVSRSGTLVYSPGWTDPQRTPRSLVWVDRKGHEEPLKAPLRAYNAPRLSPDGARIVVDIKDRQSDIWIWDFVRETLTRLTLDGALYPIWTADGRRVVFASLRARTATQNLFVRAADGAGTVDQLTTSAVSEVASSVTPDGTHVVGYETGQKTARDITLVPLTNPASRAATEPSAGAEPSHVTLLVQTSFNELNGEISPDGRYLAYESDESGRREIYVRPFPQVNAGRWQVSTGGGTRPAWARSGQELFYLNDEDLLTAVPVRTSGAAFGAGKPVRLLDTKYALPQVRRTYDVSPDGQRFLMIKDSGDPNVTPARMVVVLNWFEELKARVSTK